MLTTAARIQPGSAAFEMAVAREMFLRRFGPILLPLPCATSDIGLVLRGSESGAMAEAIVSLSSRLAGQRIDLVVADASPDPHIRLLAAHIHNLRVMHGEDAATAANLCVSITRAAMIALVEGPPCSLAHWPEPGTVWVGAAGSQSLAQHGIILPAAPLYDKQIALAAARSDWCEAAGLDSALEDGGGLEIADLALKFDNLGLRLMSCAALEDATATPDPARHWACAALFRTRWNGALVQPTR